MNTVCPVRLKKGRDEAVRAGMPWIYAGDMIASSEHLSVPPGSLVSIENHKGQNIGIGYFNPRNALACRVLALGTEPIDTAFFEKKIRRALSLREKHFPELYYRLVHSEADFLPGLLLDRFGDVVVAQVGTAGMEHLQPLWMDALHKVIAPKAVVLRNDNAARTLEGLKQTISITPSPLPLPQGERENSYLVELRENGCTYLADLLRGQKTGWFYDQRDNRAMIAALANGKTLLDVYSHSGGFGVVAAKAGADVTLVDSSKLALELAAKTAVLNGVTLSSLQGDAIDIMKNLHAEHRQFDIVLADPPAFVKSRKDIEAGMKGYAKIAGAAAKLVAPGGMLFMASCSHHATRPRFTQAVMDGIRKAGYSATIVKQTGASADHPKHSKLAQSEYLKGILVNLHRPS